jgi:cold shock CspA family protein
MVSERVKGTVKGFDATNGFGFITPDDDGEDLFIHQSSLKFDDYRSLNDSDVIELSVGSGNDGRNKAVDVTALGGDTHTGGFRPSCGHIPAAGCPLVVSWPLMCYYFLLCVVHHRSSSPHCLPASCVWTTRSSSTRVTSGELTRVVPELSRCRTGLPPPHSELSPVQPMPLWPKACIELSRWSSTPSALHRCSPLLGPQQRALRRHPFATTVVVYHWPCRCYCPPSAARCRPHH